jgi:ABC-type dipeptide/oligopeptide/nickel transport system ATPase component
VAISLLDVSDVTIAIPIESGTIQAVRGISLAIEPGETLGIVGESGSGKTMLALSFLGLLPGSARVSGSVRLAGQELLGASEAEWQRVRGDRIAMVFQDPMTALNPMYTVGWQVAECVRLHRRTGRSVAMARAIELLEAVGLPEQAARRYPHELSGGMRQRVVIAMAIANEPELLIADEPTTALDVTVQAQILDLLRSIRAQTGAAMILISHDLGVVAGVADRVLVMYAVKAVEVGAVDDVFAAPTMHGRAAAPVALAPGCSERSASIQASPPSGWAGAIAPAPAADRGERARSSPPRHVGQAHRGLLFRRIADPVATAMVPMATGPLAANRRSDLGARPRRQRNPRVPGGAAATRTSGQGHELRNISGCAEPGSGRSRPCRPLRGLTSNCGPGAAWRWSASPAAASRPWPGYCSGSTSPPRAASR